MSNLKHLRVPMDEAEIDDVHRLAMERGFKSTAEYLRQLIRKDAKESKLGVSIREFSTRAWREDKRKELQDKQPA